MLFHYGDNPAIETNDQRNHCLELTKPRVNHELHK